MRTVNPDWGIVGKGHIGGVRDLDSAFQTECVKMASKGQIKN